MCEVFRNIGLEGLDLMVRPGGHIQPADVERELPSAARAAKEHGLSIQMLTTGVTYPDKWA